MSVTVRSARLGAPVPGPPGTRRSFRPAVRPERAREVHEEQADPLGTAVPASVLPAQAVHADETRTDSYNAPQVALIATGRIDDPLEDVLEHATVLGTTTVTG
ncbi:hypothetical protein ACWEF9_26825 [Streptomyces sp. NPDC004980]